MAKIVFLNIGWMIDYRGIIPLDAISGGGSYEDNLKEEAWNFKKVEIGSVNYCFGYELHRKSLIQTPQKKIIQTTTLGHRVSQVNWVFRIESLVRSYFSSSVTGRSFRYFVHLKLLLGFLLSYIRVWGDVKRKEEPQA